MSDKFDRTSVEYQQRCDEIDKLLFDRKWDKVKWDSDKANMFLYKEWKKIKFKKGQASVVIFGNYELSEFIKQFGIKYRCTYDHKTGKIEVFNHA